MFKLLAGAISCTVLLGTEVYADTYDEIGSFDSVGDGMIVVSDTAFALAAGADCYDINNRKDISCYKIQKPQWVGVTFRAPRTRTSEVIKVKAVSEQTYKESQDND